jgi:adenylate cyclase
VPTVRFLPDEVAVDVVPGETLMAAARRVGVPLASACGGEGACTTCRLLVIEGAGRLGSPGPEEAAVLAPLDSEGVIRLGCMVRAEGPAVVRRLVIDEEDEALADRRRPGAAPGRVGEERLVGVLFADIRGFTEFSEALLPYDVVHVLNRFYAIAERVVGRHGGRIATYLGDGFMALFGATPGEEAPALRAVRAGLDLTEALADWRGYVGQLHGRELKVSLGVHFGPAVVGALGSGESRIITAVGDVVNTAARIEQANRAFGTDLLVSEAVAEALGDRLRATPLPPTALAGKRGRHVLHAVEGLA